jgi:hypothetical protein
MKRPWADVVVRISQHPSVHFCIQTLSPKNSFYIYCVKRTRRRGTKRPRAILYLQVRGQVGTWQPFCIQKKFYNYL